VKFPKKLLKSLLFLSLAGCAARTTHVPDMEHAGEPSRKNKHIFAVVTMHHPPGEQAHDSFNRKILGEWRDALMLIKDENVPVSVCVSGPVVKRLISLNKQEIFLDEVITLDPVDINPEQCKYLSKKYEIAADTHSLLTSQIAEALELLGSDLKNDPFIVGFMQRPSFSVNDKKELIDFINEKIKEFDVFLKAILDSDKISEGVTTLSNSHIGLLDKERIKVQILESMVNYKYWRGEFPNGFVSKGGYINLDAVKQLEKTNIEWVVAVSTGQAEYVNTRPQVLYCTKDAFDALGINNFGLEKKERSSVVITDLEQVGKLINNKRFKMVGYKRFLKDVLDDVDEENSVKLSSTTFNNQAMDFSDELRNVKRFLEEARQVVYKYRNSGRAKLAVLNEIRDILLLAEAGEIYDRYKDPVYERTFRKSLIDIYSKTGISPPIELFFSILEKESVITERDINSEINVKCDGVIEPDEWDGALQAKFISEDIDEIYCGFDKRNLNFLIKFSTNADIESAGVNLGHMDVDRAALVPRKYEYKIVNIQDYPILFDVCWRKKVPSKTIIYRTTGNNSWEALTGNYNVGFSSSTGILEFKVPLKYIDVKPKKQIYFKVYANGNMAPENNCFTVTVPDFNITKGIISFIDPVGDMYGPGNFKLSEWIEDYKGNLDIRRVDADENVEERVITIELSSLDNPYDGPLGFSMPVIDLYIDVNNRSGVGRTRMLKDRNAYTSPEDAWEYCITINGWEKAIYNTTGRKIGEPVVSVSPLSRTINIFIEKELIPASVNNWGIIPVLLAGDNNGDVVKVAPDTGDNTEDYRGRKTESDTNIIDVVLPYGYRQNKILGANRRRGGAIEVPALRK
jgi:hypothetical protein